jgi:hypothetical protein
MARQNKSWFDRPYETWGKGSKKKTGSNMEEILVQNRQRRFFMVCSMAFALSLLSMFWGIFSDVTLWDRDGVKNFGIGMFILFLIGFPLGFFLATKLRFGRLYFLQIFATSIGVVGALGLILMPVFLYVNYILDFSEPEVIAVTVSDMKLVGNVGKRSHRFTFVMTQPPFETQILSGQNGRYSHLRVGESALLVSGKGFLGLRYVLEIRSNRLVDRAGRDTAQYFNS